MLVYKAEIAQMLIDAGADVNASAEGSSVVMTASARNSPDLLQMVVDAGADCTTLNNNKYATHYLEWGA